MISEFPKSAQGSLLIQGNVGQLEVLTTYPAQNPAQHVVAIICHPHPLFDGTMHNKVVYTLARVFQQRDIPTVRFNFRGVGRSDGEYGHGQGEIEDLLAVIKWVQQTLNKPEIILAGFSFGSYIAAFVTATSPSDIRITHLLTVAPAVNHFEYEQLPVVTCPWILVIAERDDIVPLTAIEQWLTTRAEPITVLRFPEADHFFHGQLIELREKIAQSL